VDSEDYPGQTYTHMPSMSIGGGISERKEFYGGWGSDHCYPGWHSEGPEEFLCNGMVTHITYQLTSDSRMEGVEMLGKNFPPSPFGPSLL